MIVVAGGMQGVNEFVAGAAAEGINDLWPVERDVRNVIANVRCDVGVVHDAPLSDVDEYECW